LFFARAFRADAVNADLRLEELDLIHRPVALVAR
jgi:hypothetical protein